MVVYDRRHVIDLFFYVTRNCNRKPIESFHFCFLQIFVSRNKLPIFLRTKNHVNIQMPIDSFIIVIIIIIIIIVMMMILEITFSQT